jgi:hypothetical protein
MKYRRLFESQLVSWAPNARFADPKNPEEVQKVIQYIQDEIEMIDYNIIAGIADKMMENDFYLYRMTIEQEHGEYETDMIGDFQLKVGYAIVGMMERTLYDPTTGYFEGSSYHHNTVEDEGFYPMFEKFIYGKGEDNLDNYILNYKYLHHDSPLNQKQILKIANMLKKYSWYKELLKIMEDADNELYDYAAEIKSRY